MQRSTRKNLWILGALLSLPILVFVSIYFLQRKFPEVWQGLQWEQGRKIEAKTTAQLSDLTQLQIILIRENGKLYLEAYKNDQAVAVHKLPLGLNRVSSIAIGGTYQTLHILPRKEQNQQLQLAVALMDETLVPRLLIFGWDQDTQRFQSLPPESLDF